MSFSSIWYMFCYMHLYFSIKRGFRLYFFDYILCSKRDLAGDSYDINVVLATSLAERWGAILIFL